MLDAKEHEALIIIGLDAGERERFEREWDNLPPTTRSVIGTFMLFVLDGQTWAREVQRQLQHKFKV